MGKIAGIAAVSGIPFTGRQAEQLTALIATTSTAYAKGGVANFREIDWAAVDAGARNLLSVDQLRLLQRADLSDARSRRHSQCQKRYSPTTGLKHKHSGLAVTERLQPAQTNPVERQAGERFLS